MLAGLGRAYTTVSFAALPTALLVVLVMLATFREKGPQSQGLGALAVLAAAVLGGLLLNAIVAGVLSATVRPARPRARHVALTALVASMVLCGLLLLA